MKQRLVDFFVTPLRAVETEQRQFLATEESQRLDWGVALTLITAAVALTVQYYCFTERPMVDKLFSIAPENLELARRAYWVFGQFVAYVVIPVPVILLLIRRPLSSYGVKLKGCFACWWVYALMYLVMVPIILWISGSERFQHTYPFYRLAEGESWWPRLIIWEMLYALQFAALEFFFRGFMLHGVKLRFGAYAIFVMTVPYCLIHFGKPMPETLGAIVAGIVLGFMSLKTRSVWMGAALHTAVAWTMDAAALWNR